MTEPPFPPVPDTTSHNFMWHLDTLGDGYSSVLNDVVIINDSLAYAVGGIYLNDSLGNYDPNAYNLAKWDGKKWSLIRIEFYSVCGQSPRSSDPASSVLAFGENDIWVSLRGDQLARWNGTLQTATICSPVTLTISKLWGGSPNSIYLVGMKGEIVHFDGSTWQQLPSPTTLWIRDIWGAVNPKTTVTEIVGVASNKAIPVGMSLFSINGANVLALSDSGLLSPYEYSGIWFVPNQKYYVAGDGLYEKTDVSSVAPWARLYGGSGTFYTEAIRGNGANDIIVVGDYGIVLHFNGSTWKNFQSVTQINGLYAAVAMKGNLVIAVGFVSPRAVVLIGRRSSN